MHKFKKGDRAKVVDLINTNHVSFPYRDRQLQVGDVITILSEAADLLHDSVAYDTERPDNKTESLIKQSRLELYVEPTVEDACHAFKAGDRAIVVDADGINLPFRYRVLKNFDIITIVEGATPHSCGVCYDPQMKDPAGGVLIKSQRLRPYLKHPAKPSDEAPNVIATPDAMPYRYKDGDRARVIVVPDGVFPFRDRSLVKGDVVTIIPFDFCNRDLITYASECRDGPPSAMLNAGMLTIHDVGPYDLKPGDNARVIFTGGSYPFYGRSLLVGDIVQVGEFTTNSRWGDNIAYKSGPDNQWGCLYMYKIAPSACTCTWEDFHNTNGLCTCGKGAIYEDAPV